uniref:Uncharacterized protein n=1 Tax=Mus musculus TaxID=10090 RepID=Q3UG41_MOUSE|nr:unnamed protein product [Mus musculus]
MYSCGFQRSQDTRRPPACPPFSSGPVLLSVCLQTLSLCAGRARPASRRKEHHWIPFPTVPHAVLLVSATPLHAATLALPEGQASDHW